MISGWPSVASHFEPSSASFALTRTLYSARQVLQFQLHGSRCGCESDVPNAAKRLVHAPVPDYAGRGVCNEHEFGGQIVFSAHDARPIPGQQFRAVLSALPSWVLNSVINWRRYPWNQSNGQFQLYWRHSRHKPCNLG